MNYRRFRLIQEYTCPDGTLPAGSEIDILGDRMFFNGGMVQPQYYDVLAELISDDKLNKQYLREVPIPYNKI